MLYINPVSIPIEAFSAHILSLTLYEERSAFIFAAKSRYSSIQGKSSSPPVKTIFISSLKTDTRAASVPHPILLSGTNAISVTSISSSYIRKTIPL